MSFATDLFGQRQFQQGVVLKIQILSFERSYQTKRDVVHGLESFQATYQTVRTRLAGLPIELLLQTERDKYSVFSETVLYQTFRDKYSAFEETLSVQTLRYRTKLFSQPLLYQTVRDIQSVLRVLWLLDQPTYIGDIHLFEGYQQAELENMVLFPHETKTFSIRVQNDTGKQIYNVKIKLAETDEDTLEHLARRLFGVTDLGVDEQASRVKVSVNGTDWQTMIGYDWVTIKPDAISAGRDFMLYVQITQPETVLPVVSLPLEMSFEVVQ